MAEQDRPRIKPTPKPEGDSPLQSAAQYAFRMGAHSLGREMMEHDDREYLERQRMLADDRLAWARLGIDIDNPPDHF